ncbi:conserved hypothetical protein [Paecilomyces variotii No. 5]|uniref:Endo-1,3(4)-beta-glucanase n=1 Tax=Byssochlamys spectabilis (strain No. 5 / NBRC 109023) TaxID=1356009 RepID=V5HSI6_BYSSN|nr:conserved hypothetical protein [Paecilomyces variotii No. 5]
MTDYSNTSSRYGTYYDPTSTTYDTTGTVYAAGTAYDAGTTYDTTTAGTGAGATTYDPTTGAYDQHLDYDTDGSRRHHRERMDDSGRYLHRDVDTRLDGSQRVHKEYSNPNTGTAYHRDYER